MQEEPLNGSGLDMYKYMALDHNMESIDIILPLTRESRTSQGPGV